MPFVANVLAVTGDAICREQNPCENGGQCRPLLGDYYCDCRDNTTGRNCERSQFAVCLFAVSISMGLLTGCRFTDDICV